MRFAVIIPNEPPQSFKKRSAALAYLHTRQLAGTLPDSAQIRDTKTGTILKIPEREVTKVDTIKKGIAQGVPTHQST